MTETFIHPLSVVEDGARLGAGVRIGPFCHVGPEVELGDNVELISHVVVSGATTVGEGTVVHPQAVLGGLPQNVRHEGGRSTLTIGKRCIIRECATLHLGTDVSRGRTEVGDDCMLMAYSHVAHDCVVGNHVTMANCASLSGHCDVGDYVTLGGFAGVHQFARIGHHAFIAGDGSVYGDVIPYGMLQGDEGRLRGLNLVGMRRSGMPEAERQAAKRAYNAVFDPSHTLQENLAAARTRFSDSPVAMEIIEFLSHPGKRAFARPSVRATQARDGESG